MKLPWRKVIWVYRSAAGGWYVSIFRRGWHVTIERVPDPSLTKLIIQTLNAQLGEQPNVFANNALIARLSRKGTA